MKFIKNKLFKKLINKIENDLDFEAYYKKTVKKVCGQDVIHSVSHLNRKCHQNSYDEYVKNNDNKIIIAFCIDKENNGFVHFLNYNKTMKKYIDNTLGGESIFYNYYIFKSDWIVEFKINKDVVNPSEWLGIVKQDIYDRYCKNWLCKLFINKNDL